MALGRGHGGGHRGGGGGGRRFGGRGGFVGPSWGGGPWYDYDYGPLVIVEDDDEEKRRIALLAAQAAAQAVAQQRASTKGLGIFRPQDKVAHPLGSLAGASGPVPSNCWSAAGFKDCQARVMTKSQSICSDGQTYPNAAWATYDDCVNDYTAAFTGPSDQPVTCVSTYCPQAGTTPTSAKTGAQAYPWHTYSADTLALQKSTNDYLSAAGYCPILEDGKLGADTCGARKALKATIPGISWPSTCQSYTTPSKPPCKAAATASSSYKPAALPMTPLPPPTMQASMGGGFNWKTAALIGGGIAVAGLVFYMVRKKQAEAA